MKLNVGSGAVALPGYESIDRVKGKEAFPLPVSDGSVEAIRASHILEHFPYKDVLNVVKDWHRALQADGVLEVSVPDIDKVMKLRATDPKWRHYLMGGQIDDNDFHKVAFDRDLLETVLEQAGFSQIEVWDGDSLDTSSHPVSLNLRAVKNGTCVVMDPEGTSGDEQQPISADMVKVKVLAVMNLPRIGWNDNWGCAFDALRKFNVPVMRTMGPFWGQCMQKALTFAAEKDVDWVLTIDYDTMFNSGHLNELFRTMAMRKDIDALAALQCRRNKFGALAHIKGANEVKVYGEPVEVHSAHFGLTLIRVSKLKSLPKPWFVAVPNPKNGEYDEDRIDDDIFFWRAWNEAGHTCYLHPGVRVGHLELMCSQYNEKLEPSHMHVREWRNRFDDSNMQAELSERFGGSS